MITPERLAELTAEALEYMRYEIANIDNEWQPCADLGELLGYSRGRLDVLRDLGALAEEDHAAALRELLAAVKAARIARGEPAD